MYVLLVVQSGFSPGRQVFLPRGKQVRVGRSSQADFAFAKDSFISATHFLLENNEDSCWVTDLNSRNGTYVNGQKIQRSRLNDGDTIMAGHTVFSVQLKSEDAEIARDAASHFSRMRDTDVKPVPVTSDITPAAFAARYCQDRLLQRLRDGFQPLYAVLRQEADKKLLAHMYDDPDFESLSEKTNQEMQDARPKLYLARLFGDSLLLEMLVRQGWGHNWGIYVTYVGGFNCLAKHLSGLLEIKSGYGVEKFHYYDPCVLRDYLRTCTPREALCCMGPIDHILLEAESPAALLVFSRTNSAVTSERIPLDDAPPFTGRDVQ
jgi:pSer/pThr/pTyr-binding forkhead associated (FHA) protein